MFTLKRDLIGLSILAAKAQIITGKYVFMCESYKSKMELCEAFLVHLEYQELMWKVDKPRSYSLIGTRLKQRKISFMNGSEIEIASDSDKVDGEIIFAKATVLPL